MLLARHVIPRFQIPVLTPDGNCTIDYADFPDVLPVVGETDDSYLVEFGGVVGSVRKDDVFDAPDRVATIKTFG